MALSRIKDNILSKTQKAQEALAKDFYESIKSAWPLETGASRDAWELNTTDKVQTVQNNLDYSSILWDGRLFNGKWLGSTQMPAGGLPVLQGSLNKFSKIWEGL